MINFWEKLNKPILALAPMYDVTDEAFRRVIAKYGKPDVMWTEFVSTDGLMSAGLEKLKHHLLYSEEERPIVAQIFGAHPEKYEGTARLLQDMRFDGIDINMGCPDKAVMKQGSCAALFNNQKLAQDIVRKTKSGAPNLPVSVKIRIGDAKIDWENWIYNLLEVEPAAITIHLRTRKEMSKVPAHWEIMPDIIRFVEKETNSSKRPLILGNGDVQSPDEAKEKVNQTGCDGVMIGRGIFGNPFLFSIENKKVNLETKLNVLTEHIEIFGKLFGKEKPFALMKKHFKSYVADFSGCAELREKLYNTNNTDDAIKVIKNFTSNSL